MSVLAATLGFLLCGAREAGAGANPAAGAAPEHRLGASLTHRRFAGGLGDWYGAVRCKGVTYSRRISTGVRFEASAGYGRRSVELDRDPTFLRSGAARVELLPVEVGLRLGRLEPGALELTLGIALEGLWIREIFPPAYGGPGTKRSRLSAFVPGGRVALGPQWRIPESRFVLGADVSVELMGEAYDAHRWAANPTAVGWRLSLVRAL